MRNPPPLTDRQRQVWHLIATGLCDKEIGRAMGLSYRTVKIHARNLYAREGFRNRVQAALRWYGI